MDKKQLKQHKSTFRFGASVKYDFVLSRRNDSARWNGDGDEFKQVKHWQQKQVSTRTGIVVGWRWLTNGIGNYDSENGSSYTATEALFVIEVKRGMMNKADLILPGSLTRGKIPPEASTFLILLPKLPDRIPTMSDKDRKWLSNAMKSVPRDSKGRWK